MGNISDRTRKVAAIVVAILFVKVFASVLYEYRWYFPPNFESSNFLIDREPTFVGVYRWAFYTHIIVGPLAIVLGTWLMWSARKPGMRVGHRRMGRIQFAVIVLVSFSGLIMSRQAMAGPLATAGLASLAIATLGSAGTMVWFAMKRKIPAHQRWATRCYILLISPLILRIVGGVLLVTDFGADWTYRLNTWLSWILPLLIYEAWLRWPAQEMSRTLSRSHSSGLTFPLASARNGYEFSRYGAPVLED